MPDTSSKQPSDELTPAFRKTLVEIGVIIPTSAAEVRLVEPKQDNEITSDAIATAFAAVQQLLDGKETSSSFMKLSESTTTSNDDALKMAARKGTKLDADTLSKIAEDVDAAIRKPPQS